MTSGKLLTLSGLRFLHLKQEDEHLPMSQSCHKECIFGSRKNVASGLGKSSGHAISTQEALRGRRAWGTCLEFAVAENSPSFTQPPVCFIWGLWSCTGDGDNVTFLWEYRCPVDLSPLLASLTRVTQLVGVQARITARVF